MLAATPANAADVTGKWYGRLGAEPVISINKVGTQYSASLDYADSKGPIKWGDHVFQGETNKYLVSFRVTGGNVRFSIRTLTS